MFQSPLKTVAEKIKPTDTKSSVSSLRFDRSSDFKKFIKFIKNETEQLEKIKLPTTTEIKGRGGSKLPGAAGILGLGLFGLIASLFGGDDKGDNKFRIGGAGASDIPTIPPLGLGSVIRKTPIKLATPGGIGTLKTRSTQTKTQAQDEAYIKQQKKERQKKIKNIVKKYELRFAEEFDMIKSVELEDLRLIYGEELSDIELEKKFLNERQINPDTKKPYKSLNEKIIRETKSFLMDFEGLEDPRDLAYQKETMKNLKIDQLLNKIDEPLTMDDINLLKKLINDTDPSSQDALEALEILRSPEAQSIIKEEKFQKITGKTTPKASKIFGFTPKYALDDFFTGIGEKTKGFRDFMSRPFTKSSGKPTGFGKTLMPAMSFGSKFLKFGGFGLDLFSAIFATAELVDGFIVGDNILTAYYDLGVAVHNAFQPDKTKLMFYITKSRNAKKNAFTDKKNQEILQQINEAKKSQVNNNQVSAQEGSSGIVPFAKAVSSSPMGITMVPTIYSWKFITEKLYKQ